MQDEGEGRGQGDGGGEGEEAHWVLWVEEFFLCLGWGVFLWLRILFKTLGCAG